jgi:hypothetical protein
MFKNLSSSLNVVQISFNCDPSGRKLHSDTDRVGFFGTYQETPGHVRVEVVCNLVIEQSTAGEYRQDIY